MKKQSLLLAILGVLLLASCGSQKQDTQNNVKQTESTQTSEPLLSEDVNGNEGAVTFTDALGREVTVNRPERVVTLLGSFADAWLLAGGNLVGTASDTFTNYDYDLSDVIDVGSHMRPDAELIISLKPDFVIASSYTDAQVELLETLENAGITVAYFYVNNFEDYLEELRIFTDITGRGDLYQKNGVEVRTEIEVAKEQSDGSRPTVLFIRAAATNVKVKGSEGTVGGEILADLDTVNIADSESLLEDLSMEAIIFYDPDYIFVTTQGSDSEAALSNLEELLVSNPAWNSLKAVKSGNYYVIDKALYNSKPNARWGEAYQKLADILYPKE